MYSELFTTTANTDFRGDEPNPTFVRQQSIVQEFGGGSKVHRDVSIREVVYFNAHVLNVHASVKWLVGVDSCTVSCVQDVCDAYSLQTGLIHCNRPGGGGICLTVCKMTHPNVKQTALLKSLCRKWHLRNITLWKRAGKYTLESAIYHPVLELSTTSHNIYQLPRLFHLTRNIYLSTFWIFNRPKKWLDKFTNKDSLIYTKPLEQAVK